MAMFNPQRASRGPFVPGVPPTAHAAPPGTFVPGTKVQVGNHRVIIDKYLSEGGFAHVYVVRLPRPVDGNELAVLKRVAVPDKENLANMRTEVETMKRLRGRSRIVKYFDSHASQLAGGGYEVFLLMEYCAGGGLIDFMNTRLQQRLTEPEILRIFTDVAEGVADMHYLKPPLLHRDLKVENVLISISGSSKTYKVCDFGSTAPPRPAATTAAEGRLIEDDIQRHTTLQYRSPEMIDVYRKQPIDEKSDIWALGVLLYKLCYYTTPFEEVGQMAILNARFKYPAYPVFSDKLKLLIATMLKEQPEKRPNIYQVLYQACKMQGKEVPIKDIYSAQTQSEKGEGKKLPDPSSSQSRVGATLSPPVQQQAPSLPDIAPMRRGRPDKPVSHHSSARPSPSPLRMMDSSDPFASLDGGKAARDELSSKFPTLDEFSLLADSGKKFEFTPSTTARTSTKDPDLSIRVTHALADEAFARAPSPVIPKPSAEASAFIGRSKTVLEHKKSAEAKEPQSLASQPVPIPRKPAAMVSTGTMTKSSPPQASFKTASDRPIHRFPPSTGVTRPASQPQVHDKALPSKLTGSSGSRLANLLRDDASKSQPLLEHEPKSPTSSRPSLEGGRPSMREVEVSLHRSRSLNMRARPLSAGIGARPTHIKDQEIRRIDYNSSFASAEVDMPPSTSVESDTNITSDVDFLKAREEEEKNRKHHHKRLSSSHKHAKRSSLPSISLAGTKNLLAGRFGDAFRKFEGNSHDSSHHRDRSPSPSRDPLNVLTPIAGSEATDLSDDRHGFEDTEDLPPEMRRELEKRRLEAEERRVAAAAAEYRKRMAERESGQPKDSGKAASIQNKVQSYLNENEKPATQAAAGYGRFADQTPGGQMQQFESHRAEPTNKPVPSLPHAATEPKPVREHTSMSAPPSQINLSMNDQSSRPAQRPAAPPKPKVLRTGTGRGDGPLQTVNTGIMNGAEVSSPGDDWEANFSKRYPSLSGLEMVETDIGAHKPLRTREV